MTTNVIYRKLLHLIVDFEQSVAFLKFSRRLTQVSIWNRTSIDKIMPKNVMARTVDSGSKLILIDILKGCPTHSRKKK